MSIEIASHEITYRVNCEENKNRTRLKYPRKLDESLLVYSLY